MSLIDAVKSHDTTEQRPMQAKERDRRALDYQMKDMQAKLDEAEQASCLSKHFFWPVSLLELIWFLRQAMMSV